jgi:glycosyltransferase involved in cell wall biosynthesis
MTAEPRRPMISFVIPAHNEERQLPRTLTALVVAANEVGEPYEIIVVSDASTDRTRDIAVEHGAQVVDVQHRQIAATRNAGARASAGDILFFIDADTQANAPAIRAALDALHSGAVGGGCIWEFDGPLPLWGRVVHPFATTVGRLVRLTGGCFLFCHRETFDAVGGFCEQIYAAEDLEFIRALKRHGRFVIPHPTVVTSNRKLATLSRWSLPKLTVRILVHGPRSFKTREGLDLWYGPAARP